MQKRRILDSIEQANDIKKVSPQDYKKLADEIRKFLIRKVSKTGGHVASNLGVVELTMALHLCMDFPKDKLIWDVGHQAYTHKILTGRKDGFNTLRHYEGLCGFPKMEESDCDAFNTGHSSTSISAALGYAKAREILREDYKVVAVIGDGALSGGMAFEALNNAARLESNMIIVLNDNNMSINENVGGMANYLGTIRTGNAYHEFKKNVEHVIRKMPVVGDSVVGKLKASKDVIKRIMIPGMWFEDMGLTYIGPIDGHDIGQLKKAFISASKANRAVIVHVITRKGKGYKYAEENPSKFHGIGSFKTRTGECKAKKGIGYTEVFSNKICEMASKDEKIVAISAAMLNGTGLARFAKEFPDRIFDVGIAEEHAVTFAAGLAAGGVKPVVALYSTFVQRAFDQILHDVCLSKQHVVIAIDRAGVVGPDGATHQGIYDLSFLRSIPNLTVLAPKNKAEFEVMIEYAINGDGPIAIRYPKGIAYEGLEPFDEPIRLGKGEYIFEGKDIALVAIGSMVSVAKEVYDKLKEKGLSVSLINLRFASPIDKDFIIDIANKHNMLVTMEENVYSGGIGQHISSILEEEKIDINNVNISIPDGFLEHGERGFLLYKLGLDSDSIYNTITSKIDDFDDNDTNSGEICSNGI